MAEREVKAWAVIRPRGGLPHWDHLIGYPVYRSRRDAEWVADDPSLNGRVVRCTITYDDGKEGEKADG